MSRRRVVVVAQAFKGGLGFGIVCFGRGSLRPGACWTLDRLGFDQQLRTATLAVVGEGAFDRTSLQGKLSGEVIERCRRGVPTLVVAPQAESVPQDVRVQTGGAHWSAHDLTQHIRDGVHRALRLPHH